MKIRNGFVSNSSSSSFILILDKKPADAKELKKLLWPKSDNSTEYVYHPYTDNVFFTTDEIVEYLFDQITFNDPNDLKYFYGREFNDIVYRINSIEDLVQNAELENFIRLLSKFKPDYDFTSAIAKIFSSKFIDDDIYEISQTIRSEIVEEIHKIHGVSKFTYKYNLPPEEKTKYDREEKKYIDFVKKYVTDDKRIHLLDTLHLNNFTRIDDLMEEINTIYLEYIKSSNKGKVFAHVTISDSDRIGSTIENGEVFKNVKAEKRSNH